MFILGWDIGIKNLSCCLLETTAHGAKIVDWRLINLQTSGKDIYELHVALTTALNEIADTIEKAMLVVIENQPSPNIKMKTIAASIFQYMVMVLPGVPVRYSGAKTKMKTYSGPELVCPRKTKRDKWLAIEHVRWHLRSLPSGDKWVSFFNANKKKQDDLADSFLHALVNARQEVGACDIIS
jgi:hypothetical protein